MSGHTGAWGPTPEDDLVWHYTDARGLQGILKTRRLFASHIRHLNDTSEMRYGLQVMAEGLEWGRLDDISFDLADYDLGDRLRSAIRNVQFGIANAPVLVASASDGRDILNQWQYYGARGFAIGMMNNWEGQWSVRRKLPAAPLHAKWSRIEYNRTLQIEAARETLTVLATRAHEMCEEFDNTGLISGQDSDFNEIDLDMIVQQYMSSVILSQAALFKDEVFASEREWRMVFHEFDMPALPSGRPGDVIELPFATSGARLATHLTFDADLARREHVEAEMLMGGLPIRAIHCGPSGRGADYDKQLRARVSALLEHLEIDHWGIEVTTSSLPFRGR